MLAAEVVREPEQLEELKKGLQAGEWPDVYLSHPVVQRTSEAVLPCAFFADGVPFQVRDSLLCFTVHSLVSGRRHICAMLRASTMCRCGCTGYHSIEPIMRFLRWSLESLASGEYPRLRW
eukprot:11762703-Alexandrium_andersonii.AAC.1